MNMDIRVRKYPFGDKHSHLKHLLLESCQIELDKANYDDAYLVAQNFLWLYPDDQDSINKLKVLFTTMGNKLFDEKNQDEIHNFITPLIKKAPFVADAFEKQVISSLSIDLEEHYTSLAFRYFLNGQYQSALPYSSFVLLLNIGHKKAKLLTYMIHRSIFMNYQKTSGDYALSESFYLIVESNLILVTVLYDLVRRGILLFLDKIVGRCELKRKKICFKNLRTQNNKPLIKIGYLFEQKDISIVITHLDEGDLVNFFYVIGSKKTQIRLEDFMGNDISSLIKGREISPDEYEIMSVAS